MLNRKQIREQFSLGSDDEPVRDAVGNPQDSEQIVRRLFRLQLAGREHGRQGFYPEGDFSSDADWVNGVGAQIARLESLLEIEDGQAFDLYSEAHSFYFRDGTINPGERDWKPGIYDLQFGANGDTHVSVHARWVEDALETATEHLADIAPGLFSEPDYADAARELGLLLRFPDGLLDEEPELEAIRSLAETDHTYTESGWLLSWEWWVDGPR